MATLDAAELSNKLGISKTERRGLSKDNADDHLEKNKILEFFMKHKEYNTLEMELLGKGIIIEISYRYYFLTKIYCPFMHNQSIQK